MLNLRIRMFLKNFLYSKELVFIFVTFISLIGSLLVTLYAKNVESKIANNFLRLHIIANSNSKEDQELKLKIRDRIVDYTKNLFVSSQNIKESKNLILSHRDKIINIALDEIHDNGLNYDVDVKLGHFLFPTKSYRNISLPAGLYEAVKVEIGEAKGENWWCVLFPPFCLIDGFDIKESKEGLGKMSDMSENELELISNDTSNIGFRFKFKLVEIFAPLFLKNKV